MSYFIVPMIGTPRGPKYINGLGVSFHAIDIGDTAVVWANTTAPQDVTISANVDAILLPGLDTTVLVAATTKTALEALNIPAQWVVAGMTYRALLKSIIGMAMIVQRTDGMGSRVVLAGNLDTQMSTFSTLTQNAIRNGSDSLALNRSTLVATTPLRTILQTLGDQLVAIRDRKSVV